MFRKRRPFMDAPAEEPFSFPEADTVIALWTLRLLVRAGALSKIHQRGRWPDSDILASIGMNESYIESFELTDTQQLLRERLEELEDKGADLHGAFLANARLLGAQLNLSSLEQEILALVAVLSIGEGLSDCLKYLGPRTLKVLSKMVACALDAPADQVRKAFEPAGALVSSRLIKVQFRGGAGFADDPLELSDALQDVFHRPHKDADGLLRSLFRASPPSTFGVEDFPHVKKDLDVLVRFMSRAVEQRTQGVNVLLHGPPGTGKTELARVVATHVGATLYEVSVEDDDGDALLGRSSTYAMCQRALARRPHSMVLFDEIEDAIPEPQIFAFRRPRRGELDKGWLNRSLETNPVPAIWVGNTVDYIDPAILRRFDFILEVREPPPNVRRRMIEHHTQGLPVGEAWIERTSVDRRVGPGHLQRATKVARLIEPNDADDAEQILDRVLDASLLTSVRKAPERNEVPKDFELSLLNTDCDLPELLTGLQNKRAGSLCLFGPPGTGKTMFARHVAHRLGMPLHARRASDLLGSFVGQTEANLAKMFSAAERDEAVLFLDEADSFLQDRRRAIRSWEVTQVNELLVQMEAFGGVFICATNLVDVFDVAAARRFALQIRFDPLTAEGANRMFCSVLQELGGATPDVDVPAALSRLTGLTPGDFAAVRKRLDLLGGELSAGRLLKELGKESARKPASDRSVGFRP